MFKNYALMGEFGEYIYFNFCKKNSLNPKFIRMCDLIIRYKPENVELKDFLASCLTSDLNKKRQLVN